MLRLAGFIVVGMVLAALLSGCGQEEDAPREEVDAEFPVSRSFGAGPVKLAVGLSAEKITTADALRVRITLNAKESFEAEFPDLAFPEDVPGAILTDHESDVRTEGKRRIETHMYELEPEFEGTLTLPAMEVYYRRAGEVKEDMFETQPIEIAVEPTPEGADVLEIRPVRGIVTVEQIEAEQRRIWPWVVGAAAFILGGGALVVHLVRRPKRAPPPRPPHEIAIERLRQLRNKDLIGRGEVEPFFVEVTTIVRDYIEGAFGVRAPEQTTEEFLANMTSEPAVARHRDVLGPFLVAADEVKFARLVPERDVMQRAFDTAEQFVRQTSSAS